MLKGNLRFLSHQKALIEGLKEYPYLDENSVEISMIRSQISALEMTLSTAFARFTIWRLAKIPLMI